MSRIVRPLVVYGCETDVRADDCAHKDVVRPCNTTEFRRVCEQDEQWVCESRQKRQPRHAASVLPAVNVAHYTNPTFLAIYITAAAAAAHTPRSIQMLVRLYSGIFFSISVSRSCIPAIALKARS